MASQLHKKWLKNLCPLLIRQAGAVPGSLYLFTLDLTTRRWYATHHRPADEQGGSLVKSKSPSSAPGPVPSAPPPSRAGRANLGVEERASWLHTETVSLISFQYEDLGDSFYLKTYVYLGNWSPVAEEPLLSSLHSRPPGSSPALPSWEHIHLISSSAKVEESAGHPCPRGALKAPPPQPCTAACSPLILTMGYRRQCYKIKQEKSSWNFN